MEKNLKTKVKTEKKGTKKRVNPFRDEENCYHYSSKKLHLGPLTENVNNNSYNKRKRTIYYSDRNLIKINFLEKKKSIKEREIKKDSKERIKAMKSNETKIKSKNSTKSENIISIPSLKLEDIYKWKSILYNHNRTFSISQLNENINNNDDDKILNQKEDDNNNNKKEDINDDDYLEDDIDVLKKDVVRTRVSETKLIKDYLINLELLIKYFLKENKVKYKQGLNEIIGAFLILKYTNIKEDMTLSEIYNLLNGFIYLFVFNYYYEESFYSIKNSFSLLTLLIKYHSPEIHNLFEKASIFPELYATSWLITAFSYKLQLNNLFYFWNKLISENDPLMLHYLIVALLIIKKNTFINYDIGCIPIIINKIGVETEQEIDELFTAAINLRKKTPYSFRIFALKLDVLKHRSTQHQIKYDLYHPDTLISIPIFPSEIFYICYKDIIKCPDEYHLSNLAMKANCEHCDMKIEKDMNYILFDLRILEKGKFESNNEKTGFLPQMIMIEQKELKDNNFIDIVNKRFSDVKNKYHFIFMTYNTDCLNVNKSGIDIFMNSLNSQNENNNDSKSCSGRTNNSGKITKKLTHKEKTNIKETDNMKKLLLYLIENNYQYISYIYGGFEAIHNEIMNNKKSVYSEISLLNHNDEKCEICKKNRKIFVALSPKNKKTVKKFSFIQTPSSPKKTLFSKFKKKTLSGVIPNNIEDNEIETKNKKITTDEVNKMISNTEYFAGPCDFVSIDGKKFSDKNNDNKGLLIIYDKKLFVIKTPNINNAPMEIIDEIPLNNIKNIKIKSKLITKISVINTNNNNEKNNINKISVKFNYELDSSKFNSSIDKAKKN